MSTSSEQIDLHVGRRLCEFREEAGMSKAQLAKELGRELEYVSLIEDGKSTLSAGDLWDLCRVLDVSPSAFFKGLD